MNYCVALIGVNFHIPVVLRVKVLFPHILLVLHLIAGPAAASALQSLLILRN